MRENEKLQDCWLTPPWLYNKLDKRFSFTLDAAADETNCLATQFCDDGLSEDWEDNIVFCNPPYSQKFKWIEKALVERDKGTPAIILLLPYNMEVMREFKGVQFHHDLLDKRVAFLDPVTKKPVPGNRTGTVVIYLWPEIKQGVQE